LSALDYAAENQVKKFVDASPPYLLSAAAIACFTLAIYFFWHDNLRIGVAYSTLFFVCVMLVYLPQTESIKAFSVDVKLRRSLDRAEDIMAKVRELSLLNAKLSFMTLAWSNRLSSPKATDKKVILDLVDQQLDALKISDKERLEIALPMLRIILVDLFSILQRTIAGRVEFNSRKFLQAQPRESRSVPSPATETLNANVNEWRESLSRLYRELELDNVEAIFQQVIPRTIFDPKDQLVAENFAKQVLRIWADCNSQRRLTNEAAIFLDSCEDSSGIAKKGQELFGNVA
jgi:hypothetical protein